MCSALDGVFGYLGLEDKNDTGKQEGRYEKRKGGGMVQGEKGPVPHSKQEKGQQQTNKFHSSAFHFNKRITASLKGKEKYHPLASGMFLLEMKGNFICHL